MTVGPLLRWFQPRRRAYPWRDRPTPYRVLVSEVMLQQTQAARVAPAFRAFVRRFPSVRSLAAASREEVLRAWAGLGYNRRAVALSEAARAVVRDHGGRIPRRVDELVRLPGVGPYTAAAVAALAYGEPVAAVDTNVRRVVVRHRLGVEAPVATAGEVERAARRWIDVRRPGDWNQAVMDLGREVCRPVPRCVACPVAASCRFSPDGRRPVRTRRAPAAPFEGSSRQLRGAVVRALLGRSPLTLRALSAAASRPLEEVTAAVRALRRDGVVEAGPAALDGRAQGRVRLSR
ncbi:MAG TPA: A/G-specific adenine glycosylase [Actinomycetota bacterium]|nr:A/G-specific adenine glycosylase [Actinomycetota bacterium]